MLKVLALGQSNMSGRGSGGRSPLECDSRVEVWNNTNELGADGTAFISPPDFGNSPWDANGGNNLALWFCHRAAQELQTDVRLVLVSKGGTTLAEWGPSGIMYTEASGVHSASGLGPADVLLWHQGESDRPSSNGGTGIPPADYKTNFLAMLSSLKNDGLLAANAPAIVGGLYLPTAGNIDTALQELANENDGVYYAGITDLKTSDGIHFAGASLYHLGFYRYWNQYRDRLGFPRISGDIGLVSTF
ncbi:sialate O-acetylesterase [Marinobacter nauticus]